MTKEESERAVSEALKDLVQSFGDMVKLLREAGIVEDEPCPT